MDEINQKGWIRCWKPNAASQAIDAIEFILPTWKKYRDFVHLKVWKMVMVKQSNHEALMIFFDQKSSAGLAVTHHLLHLTIISHVSSLPTIIFVVIRKFSFLGQEFLPSQAVAVGTEGFPIFAPPPPNRTTNDSIGRKFQEENVWSYENRNSPLILQRVNRFWISLLFFLKVSVQINWNHRAGPMTQHPLKQSRPVLGNETPPQQFKWSKRRKQKCLAHRGHKCRANKYIQIQQIRAECRFFPKQIHRRSTLKVESTNCHPTKIAERKNFQERGGGGVLNGP